MAEIDAVVGLGAQISRQEIFKTMGVETISVSDFQNKLVCINNSDVYMAVNNCVRYASLNTSGSYYKILDTARDCNFSIRSLQVNSLGTLIALVGDTECCIISTVLGTHNSAVLPVKTHRLGNIAGRIIKTCWQSATANDCTLVVLTDQNCVLSYDLTVSLYMPVLTVDLSLQQALNGHRASSIAFGSSSNLIGSLTLYISTFESIYAIYPFVPEHGKIATTIDQIDDAINESSLIIKTIEEKFPFTDIYDSLNSKLKLKALFQYEYFLALKKKTASGIPIPTEVRNIESSSPFELLVFEQQFVHEIIVQGPLTHNEGKVVELSEYHSNPVVSILLSISSDGNSSLISAYAQLSPLIMTWKEEQEQIPIKKTSTKKHGYIKPKKGFGFLDLSDNEDEQETEEEKTLRLRNERSQQETLYWKQEFTELSTLTLESIPHPCNSQTRLIAGDQACAINLDKKLLVLESKWIKELIKSIKTNGVPEIDFSNTYVPVSGTFDKLEGVTFIQDCVIAYSSKATDNLTVMKLEQQETKPVTPRSVEAVQAPTKLPKDLSIEKIIHEVKLQSIQPRSNSPIKADSQSLQQVNEISTEVLNKVLIYTTNTLKLLFRLQSQVIEMGSQLQTLLKIAEKEIDNDKLAESKSRYDTLLTRQQQTEQKVHEIKSNLTKYLQHLSQNKTLPLSKAERAWFKEINDINNQVNGENSLIKKVNAAETQVNSLKKNITGSMIESPTHKLKLMEVRQSIAKLQYNLQEKGEFIEEAKTKLESNFKKLAI